MWRFTPLLCIPSLPNTHTLDFEAVGGVAHAEMLGRTNLVAVVGGGQAPKFPDRNGTVGISISRFPDPRPASLLTAQLVWE